MSPEIARGLWIRWCDVAGTNPRRRAPFIAILARFAPKVLGPTLGGSLADRIGPSRVAGWSALGQCGLTAAIVIFANTEAVWAILVAVAASFALAGVLMLSMRVGPVVRSISSTRRHPSAARLVARDPMLRTLAASFFCSAAAITALQAVLVVAAAERFGRDTEVGWLYAAVGAGGIAGSLVLLRWRPPAVGASGVAAGFLAEVIPIGLFAFVSGLIPALGLLIVSTAAAALYQTCGLTALQERVPPEILGRVNGLMRLLLYLGMLAGAVAAVALVKEIGWTRLVIGVTLVSVLAFIPGSITYPRRRRRPDEVTLAGTPMVPASGQTATASRTSFSMGRPTELPHSLHDPS